MKMQDTGHRSSYLILPFQKGIGDQLSCSSLIRNLAQNRPESAIDLAVFNNEGQDLYRYNPYIRNIHLVDMQYLDFFKMRGKYQIRDKIDYLKKFRAYRYDAVYVLGTKIRFALFAYLIGAKERIGYTAHHGFTNHRRGFFLTKAGNSSLQKNIVERFLDLLVIDGMQIYNPTIELFLSEKENEAAERIFSSNCIGPGERVIALAPCAADMRRTWPLDRFWAVGEHFAKKGYKVVILGSSHDAALIQKAPPPDHHIINLTGKADILETAALIKKSVFFLGNDSGCGHLAGAVRTDSLILGYYVTTYWYPLSPTARTIIKETGCRTCTFDTIKKCTGDGKKTARCFSMISVDEVVNAIEGRLSSSKHEGGTS